MPLVDIHILIFRGCHKIDPSQNILPFLYLISTIGLYKCCTFLLNLLHDTPTFENLFFVQEYNTVK